MKTVRLPIYNEQGIMTAEVLEVDIYFFITNTSGLISSKARIIPAPMADWELELMEETIAEAKKEVQLVDVVSMHPTLTWEELEMLSAASAEDFDTAPTDCEWRGLGGIPSKNFEINQDGLIRHKGTKKVLEVEYDIDQNAYRSNLTINGGHFSIYGPALAERMWKAVVSG
jgi:hypothetical protein